MPRVAKSDAWFSLFGLPVYDGYMKKILQKDDKNGSVLREHAKEVPLEDIQGTRVKNIISDMKKTLAAEGYGVGLAAPQIGESLRIFIVGPRAFTATENKAGKLREPIPEGSEQIYINPKITKSSKRQIDMHEGCLSVRDWYGMVKRSDKVNVEAYDENGEKFQRGASGLLAQIFQHEIDHLNGSLFVDTATDLKEMPPEDENDNEK